MNEKLSYEERTEWIQSKLGHLSMDVEEELIGSDEAMWVLEQSEADKLFVGTQSRAQHIDIRYRYRPVVDLALSMDQNEIENTLSNVDSDRIEHIKQQAPIFLNAIEYSIETLIRETELNPYEIAEASDWTPEELADRIGINLDEYTPPSDRYTENVEEIRISEGDSEAEQAEGKDSAEIVNENEEDMSDWEKDWTAAHIRMESVSDSARNRLHVKLTEIMSEGPLIYKLEKSEAGILTSTRQGHRVFGLTEVTTQEFYEAIRLVKSTGRYGRNYLRYALQITEDIESDEGKDGEFIKQISV